MIFFSPFPVMLLRLARSRMSLKWDSRYLGHIVWWLGWTSTALFHTIFQEEISDSWYGSFLAVCPLIYDTAVVVMCKRTHLHRAPSYQWTRQNWFYINYLFSLSVSCAWRALRATMLIVGINSNQAFFCCTVIDTYDLCMYVCMYMYVRGSYTQKDSFDLGWGNTPDKNVASFMRGAAFCTCFLNDYHMK